MHIMQYRSHHGLDSGLDIFYDASYDDGIESRNPAFWTICYGLLLLLLVRFNMNQFYEFRVEHYALKGQVKIYEMR